MHFQENQLIQNVFFCGLIFLVFVFLRFLCKFSIISELSFMQWSLYCTISHYATLHCFQILKKHRFCIHFFSWGLSDPKWPRNNKNNRFLKKKFHDPCETQKFCFLATCHKWYSEWYSQGMSFFSCSSQVCYYRVVCSVLVLSYCF